MIPLLSQCCLVISRIASERLFVSFKLCSIWKEHEFVGLAAELSVAPMRNIPRPAAYSVDSFLVGQVIEA